MHTLT
jgi:hypothetical protein